MASKNTNHKGRIKNGKFVMLRHDIMDHSAWKSLSANSRCVWTMIVRRFNGSNNGQIPLSCREVAEELGISKDTASKSFQELMSVGFIKIAQDSAFNMKQARSRRWTLTHETLNKKAPTNEWRQFNGTM